MYLGTKTVLFLLDIDECKSSSLTNCEQICVNNEGSYLCACFDGYQLNSTDRMSCYGTFIFNKF